MLVLATDAEARGPRFNISFTLLSPAKPLVADLAAITIFSLVGLYIANMASRSDGDGYDDSNRAFLQAFMARSTMTFAEARPVLAAIFSVHGILLSLSSDSW